MKLILSLIALVLSFNVLAASNLPTIYFEYSFLYERKCPTANSTTYPYRPTDEQITLAKYEFPAIADKLYKTVVHKFFDKLEETFPGSGLKRKELTATLTLCRQFGSFSRPLTLNLYFITARMLRDRTRDSYKVSFSSLLFHELIHTWQGENFHYRNLKYIKKYATEGNSVKSHIYLMAIQEYVYRELNLDRYLKLISYRYPRMSYPYKRAWQIVQKEGYMNLIDDLKLHQRELR